MNRCANRECSRQLVRQPGEQLNQFTRRKTCGRFCFAALCRQIAADKLAEAWPDELAEVAARTAEVRREWEREHEAVGCRFTNSLD